MDAPSAAAGNSPERREAPTDDGLDPSSFIRSDFDATIILLLWCIRKSFFPLLWLGMLFATTYFVVAERDLLELESQTASLESPSAIAGALLSPFALVAIALIVRVAVGFLALAAAYPLSRSTKLRHYQDVRKMTQHVRLWRDRLYLTRAYRSLRWTWIVRNAAVERLGRKGTRLAMCNPVLRWIGITSFVLLLVALVIAAAASTQ